MCFKGVFLVLLHCIVWPPKCFESVFWVLLVEPTYVKSVIGQISDLNSGVSTRHGCWFPAKRQKRFVYTRLLEIEEKDSRVKTQEFCGVPARFGLGTPKCIGYATCFGLRLVPLSSIN